MNDQEDVRNGTMPELETQPEALPLITDPHDQSSSTGFHMLEMRAGNVDVGIDALWQR